MIVLIICILCLFYRFFRFVGLLCNTWFIVFIFFELEFNVDYIYQYYVILFTVYSLEFTG